ncbi:hypothetical protein KPATCC21470_5849 [Kitasatospora purpeofusca]
MTGHGPRPLSGAPPPGRATRATRTVTSAPPEQPEGPERGAPGLPVGRRYRTVDQSR